MLLQLDSEVYRSPPRCGPSCLGRTRLRAAVCVPNTSSTCSSWPPPLGRRLLGPDLPLGPPAPSNGRTDALLALTPATRAHALGPGRPAGMAMPVRECITSDPRGHEPAAGRNKNLQDQQPVNTFCRCQVGHAHTSRTYSQRHACHISGANNSLLHGLPC